jgi:hypothetical protein
MKNTVCRNAKASSCLIANGKLLFFCVFLERERLEYFRQTNYSALIFCKYAKSRRRSGRRQSGWITQCVVNMGEFYV